LPLGPTCANKTHGFAELGKDNRYDNPIIHASDENLPIFLRRRMDGIVKAKLERIVKSRDRRLEGNVVFDPIGRSF